MKIIFFGTPDFAVPALDALCNSHTVLAVVTMPDRPSGRKMKLTPSPVKSYATNKGLPVYEPVKLRGSKVYHDIFAALNSDVFIVAAYGLILPKKILEMPKFGCINIHASLLPKHRGPSPIHAAILAGDKKTGVTIMQMDAGIDTGDMLLQEEICIKEDFDFLSLHNMLAELGASCLIKTLELITKGEITKTPQNDSLSSYAPMIKKADGQINWTNPTEFILNQIRAFSLWPGAFVMQNNKPLKINGAKNTDFKANCPPGKVLTISQSEGLYVKTGDGVLCITELTPAGGKKMPAVDYLRGHRMVLDFMN